MLSAQLVIVMFSFKNLLKFLMKNNARLLFICFVYAISSLPSHAQSITWEQYEQLNPTDTSQFHTQLAEMNWTIDKPDKKISFNRNLICFAYKLNDNPICWIDLCFKQKSNPVSVFQFNNESLYSQFKNQIKSQGFSQSKMKLGTNDIAIALSKENTAYILRKHTYNHDTQGSYAILKLNSQDLESIWNTYINF